MKKLCIIAQYYPTEKSAIFTFVDELISKIADNGIECNVITPILWGRKNKHQAKTRKKVTAKGNVINIYCPKYFVPHKKVFGIESTKLFIKSYNNAVVKSYTRYVKDTDAFYGHFLFPSGITAAYMGKTFGKPTFVACGESRLLNNQYAFKIFKDIIYNNITEVISVSSQIKSELRKNKIISNNIPIEVLPNGIDRSKFKIMDRLSCRAKLGIDNQKFIVCFVGHFIERKGPLRVLQAIEKHRDIYGIFIGEDKLSVESERIIFCGKVSHDELPVYLNAVDVFVLPTLAEGCCNAIIEAMGCGIPIISSNLPFNDDILNDSCSIRIDPNNIDEIETAIVSLKNDICKRKLMSIGAQKMAKKFDVNIRALAIINIIEQEMKEK